MNPQLAVSITRWLTKNAAGSKPYLIGINGIDGSGKTEFARELHAGLKADRIRSHLVTIDDFHNPRAHRYQRSDAAMAYYQDSFNFHAFVTGFLKPLSTARTGPVRVLTKCHDLDSDNAEQRYVDVQPEDIVIVEGVFLFKPGITDYFDFRIFLDASIETILRRVIIRDAALLGDESSVRERYARKYLAGQKLYIADARPRDTADLVIDNNDFKEPHFSRVPDGFL